jgi:hypothetical protein
MWHGEALYGLGVQVLEALIPLGAFFLPSVAPASQQNFDLQSYAVCFCILVAMLDPIY